MAIDMIENNELSALSPSRLGVRQFVTDGKKGMPKMLNFTGTDDFVNLFGSRIAKKSAFRQDVRKKYGAIPTSCDAINQQIEVVSSDLEALVKRSASRTTLEIKEQMDETNKVLAELKSALIKSGCKAEMAQQAKVEAEQKAAKTLETLSQLGEKQVSAAKSELLGGTTDGGTSKGKILLFGGIAVAAIVGIYLYKKNK